MTASRRSSAVSASFEAFDRALRLGKLPPTGKVTAKLVRSAFASLQRSARGLSLDSVPNPLPPPHNLAWYFNQATCPDEVRVFATMLGKKHVRVWSVVPDRDGWRVLAQVFGEGSKATAAATAEIESRVPAKRLRQLALASVEPFDLKPDNVEYFMHDYARGLLERQGVGKFVEFMLARVAT